MLGRYTYTATAADVIASPAFTVVVSNSVGSVTAGPAIVFVQFPVVIDSNLLDVEALPGDIAQFSVAVSGGQPYYFQWTVDAVVQPGATTASLSVPVGPNDNGLEVQVCVCGVRVYVFMSSQGEHFAGDCPVRSSCLLLSAKHINHQFGGSEPYGVPFGASCSRLHPPPHYHHQPRLVSHLQPLAMPTVR